MNDLVQMKCVACRADSPKVTDVEISQYQAQVSRWKVVERDSIRQLARIFKFPDFREALVFTQVVGKLAEAEGHHPTLVTEWGKVTVVWWTHKINGLHRNDFIMAAKTDELYSQLAKAR